MTVPAPVEQALVAQRLESIRAKINAVSATGVEVRVLAVTKGFGRDAIRAARGAGLDAVGENYAQELLAKVKPSLDVGLAWHFIGRLQRNKVRKLASYVSVWESVDRLDVGTEIAKRAPGSRVLVQVAAWDEPDKGGAVPDEVPALVGQLNLLGLTVGGLMAIGPAGDIDRAGEGFSVVRGLADELGLSECSMGMSDDFETAVAQGATEIRIGRGLFGPRSFPAAVGN